MRSQLAKPRRNSQQPFACAPSTPRPTASAWARRSLVPGERDSLASAVHARHQAGRALLLCARRRGPRAGGARAARPRRGEACEYTVMATTASDICGGGIAGGEFKNSMPNGDGARFQLRQACTPPWSRRDAPCARAKATWSCPCELPCPRSHRSGRQVSPRGAAFLEIRRAGLFTPAGGFTEKIFGLTIGAHGSSTNGTTKKKACQKKIERRKLADHAAPRVACEQIDVSAG